MIIAGQVFKRCGNNTIRLCKDAAELPKMGDGPMAWASHAVELAKRRFQYSTAAALDAVSQKLIENQEASARVADMAMEIYAMESAVARASKMAKASHRWGAFACSLANAYANETIGKVRNNALILLAEVLEGEALQKAMKEFAAFDACTPISSAKIREAVALDLIEKGT
jgi:hypothetical protein